jgi:S-disulfanyl-L-cysteine oxidoreductase SoxD
MPDSKPLNRVSRTILVSLAIGAAAALHTGAASAQKTAPGHKARIGTAHGVYTEQQAVEGAQVYKRVCAMCHGEALYGTGEIPPLKGRLIYNFRGSSVGALYDYVSRAMPQMAPGSLSPSDNAAIVAFLLKENDMPAGAERLPADQAALDAIPFEIVQPR